ncbi:MarR family transcriptional regulator [Leifsonia sp. ZF2019]|uniref:MarR family winged helix-turn-helix transcriptional regulator n=1 Tax=Leifsonia sp. ZF2019 TaxID=2781978 RepID=UPI001CBD80AD|nr:MarR family transcriptional regulator [Leifsonia sp. ZF2019]UAJ79890.1 MarR family transcriptional regulator [Leifsonia sp. ZF2019]
MTSRTERLADQLRTILFAQRAAGEEWIRASGLSRSQSFTLAYLDENRDRGVIARELAEMSGTTPASVTSLLQGLEERGYITRESSPTDSRVKLIRITPEGTQVVTGFDDAMTAAQTRIFSVLSDDDQDALIALLQPLADALVASGDAPPPSASELNRRRR